MSLALVGFYIIIGLCFLLFVNYKFIKIFIKSPNRKYTDMNLNNMNDSHKKMTHNNNNVSDNCTLSNMMNIPGKIYDEMIF